MKKAIIFGSVFSVLALMLVSCASEPEATTTTTRQTTVTTPVAAADLANNDNNHAHGWRLLIGRTRQLEVTGAGFGARSCGPYPRI